MNVCAQFGIIYFLLFDYPTLALSRSLSLHCEQCDSFVSNEERNQHNGVPIDASNIINRMKHTSSRTCLQVHLAFCGDGTKQKFRAHNNSRYVHGCNRINKLCFCYVPYTYSSLLCVLNKVEASVLKCAHCICHPFFQFLIYSMCIEIVRLRIVVHTTIDENKQTSEQAKNQRTDITEWIAFLFWAAHTHTRTHFTHSLIHSLIRIELIDFASCFLCPIIISE